MTDASDSTDGCVRALDPRFAEYRRTRDRGLRNALVEEHAGLATLLARRFQNRGEALDDLRQVALVGLLKAVERFDPERGWQFSSFATPTITGELKRHFRDRGWAVRVPRRLQELYLELDKTVALLNQELSRPPSTAEIATRMRVTEEEVLEAMEANSLYRLQSIDAEPAHEGSRPVESTLGEIDAELERVDDRTEAAALLAALPPRERRIVYLRFFRGMTQAEIASDVGISQMHVSRLLSRSLEMLAEQRSRVAG